MLRKVVKILIAVVGLLLLVELGVIVYGRFFAEGDVPDRERYPLRGIDISHHNGHVDFDLLAREDSDVGFLYVKATEGTGFVDPDFVRNSSGGISSGVPTGAYHFFRYDVDGELQALNFVAALRGRNFSLPPAIDVEDWGNPDGHATAAIVERLRNMIRYMQSAGYAPIIYTNVDGYYRVVKGNFDDIPLWISSFSYPPLPTDPDCRRWSIWQYSHRGSVSGIGSDTDLNVINPANPPRQYSAGFSR